jgi:hypothetical protein
MNSHAHALVNQLLESRYDIDDPMDRESEYDYPVGFSATDGTDRIEWRLQERHAHFGYAFTKHWLDDYTRQVRVLRNISFKTVRSAEEARRFLETEMAKWNFNGWTAEKLT